MKDWLWSFFIRFWTPL